jgi:phosphotransferase system enzyme I (PtsP)
MDVQNRHIGLLADAGEVLSLLAGSTDVASFLDRTVAMVAEHLHADVCSIYLYDEATRRLTLAATMGLRPSAVGQVSMALGEGLVGKALKELRPIRDARASSHPDFKYFPASGEEAYEAFLGVPIQRGVEKIGVLVVQREDAYQFDESEVMTMRALTAQLASAIENARVLLEMGRPEEERAAAEKESFFLKGQSACPGFARAGSLRFRRRNAGRIIEHLLADGHGEGSPEELSTALENTQKQLEQFQSALGEKLPEVASLIFEAHMMMLKDTVFTDQMFAEIEAGRTAAGAVAKAAGGYIDIFQASKHDYMREKAQDVEDVALRVLSNLGVRVTATHGGWTDRIVIARELLPSDVLEMSLDGVAGIVLVGGGITSHIAFLVRSLNIPMIIAPLARLNAVPDGTDLLMDADLGTLFINPSSEVLERYEGRERIVETALVRGDEMSSETFTACGQRVTLLANINLLSELSLASELKAEGVGLYRSEFPFLVRQSLPSEEEQVVVYSRLIDSMEGREVTIRTLDVGGDKVLSYFDSAGEENPALGLRSTRFALRYRDILSCQLRAILRAAGGRPVSLMFPMIASLEMFREAKAAVEQAYAELTAEGNGSYRLPRIGMMVELPAVVELAREFAREADFFSIGTNDFIQYMLAVDRTNARVSDYYCPYHPSVLRGLNRVVAAAIEEGVSISLCGEMAHAAEALPFLVGIGLRRFSVDPHFLPDCQRVLQELTVTDAEAMAARLLQATTSSEVKAILAE